MSTEPKLDELAALTAHTERLVGTLTQAILTTAATAADCIELAAGVAQIQQRMAALGSVLEFIRVQKLALLARLDQATGTMRLLLQQQIAALTGQEEAILAKAGVPQPAAQLPPASADNWSNGGSNGQPAKRGGGKRPALGNGNPACRPTC